MYSFNPPKKCVRVKRGLFTSNAPSHHLALHHCPQLCSFLEYFGEGEKQKKMRKIKKIGEKVFLNDNPSVSASIPSIFHPQELFFSSRLFILISPGNTVYYYLLYWNFLWELY
jgi:hypothetical protein